MLYVSPDKFRSGGWGIDLSSVEGVELRSILHRASSMVNHFCTVPTLPVEHDFRGGTIVDELGHWDMGSENATSHRRVYPYHRPVRSVSALSLSVTNSQGIVFSAPELYVGDSFVEVVSMAMTSYGLFGAAIIPAIGLVHPQVKITYSYGYELPVVNEELEVTDSRVFRAANQWWVPAIIPTVRIDGVEADPGDYTIDYDEGTVTLPADDVTASTRVHVDYYHRLPQAIADATSMVAAELLGERNLTRKGLYGLVELAVGEVRVRRDFPRAGIKVVGLNDRAASLLEPYKFMSIRGGSF